MVRTEFNYTPDRHLHFRCKCDESYTEENFPRCPKCGHLWADSLCKWQTVITPEGKLDYVLGDQEDANA